MRGAAIDVGHSSVQTVLIELRKWLVGHAGSARHTVLVFLSQKQNLEIKGIAWALYVFSHSITLQTAVPSKNPQILSQCKRKIHFKRSINCVVCPHPSPLVLHLKIFRSGLSLCNRTSCSWLVEYRK